MPTDTAELVISCRADGTQNVNKFTDAVRQADGASNQLVKTLGGLFAAGKMINFAKQGVMAFSATQDAAWRFEQTFRDVSDEANKVAETFQRVYKLSELSAKKMIGGTGDLLTGLGFDQDFALKMSDAAGRLGTDLAGYTNYAGQAAGAVDALTAALTGENEKVKALGIVIRQDTEEWKMLTKAFRGAGLSMQEMDKIFGKFESTDKKVNDQWKYFMDLIKDSRHLTVQQANAMAAFSMSVAQSKNAIGDYIKEGESFSQALMDSKEASIQLQSELGEMVYSSLHLYDVITTVTGGINSLTEYLQKLDPEGKRAVSLFTVTTGVLLAAKSAMMGYNLASGLASAVSAKNAVAVTKEAAAHTANAAAIVAENSAKNALSAKAVTTDAIAGNARSISAANAVVQQKKLALESAKADAQRTISAERNAAVRNALTAKQLMLDAQEVASADAKALRIAQAEMRILAAQNERVKYQLALAGKSYADMPEYTAAVRNVQQLTGAYNQSAAAASNAANAYNVARNAAVAAGAQTVAANKEVVAAEKELQLATAERQKLYNQRSVLVGNAKAAESAKRLSTQMYAIAGAQAGINSAGKSIVALGASAVIGEKNVQRMGTAMLAVGAKGKAAMLAVAGATRTATVAALGLAKAFLPMLAISGAIAGIDYLINRSKRAAEARNEYADSLVAGAQKAIEAEQKQAVADNDMIARLKEMSKYSRLTTDEQEKATQMVQQLSSRYSGLADQIKIVNGQLVIGKDAWNGITEAQRQNHLQLLQKKLVSQKRSTIDQILGFQAVFDNMSSGFEFVKDVSGVFSKYTLQDKIDEAFSFDDAAIRKAILEDALSLATQHGYSEHKEYLKSIIDSLEKELQLEKEIVEIRKYVAGGGSGAKTGKNVSVEFDKALKSLKKTWHDVTMAGMTDPEKLAYFNKRYDEINQKYQAAMERSKGDLEMQTKTVQYAKELIDLEQVRAEMKRKTAEDEMNFYNQLLQNATRLRTIAQNGIDANSVEAIQMQSRRMGSGAGLQAAAKMTAEATKQAAEAAKKANDILDDIRKRQSEIYDSLAKLEVSSL